jgi:hypothetical protein
VGPAPGTPGTGETPFEILATFVFGVVYLMPLCGMVYAHVHGSQGAKRAASLSGLFYHTASVFGMRFVFTSALNYQSPLMPPPPQDLSLHVVYAVLFALLFWSADDDVKLLQKLAQQ